jgi:hypothetical protein
MRQPRRETSGPGGLFFEFLTFDRMLTGRVIHLVYWAGLGVVALVIFSVVGAAVGLALGDGLQGLMLAVPVLVAGLLVAGALALLWRSFCEFYLAIFRISEDLSALRAAQQQAQPGAGAGAPVPSAQAAYAPGATGAAPQAASSSEPARPAAGEFRRYF